MSPESNYTARRVETETEDMPVAMIQPLSPAQSSGHPHRVGDTVLHVHLVSAAGGEGGGGGSGRRGGGLGEGAESTEAVVCDRRLW